MQTAEKNKNKVRAYQSALAAFDINPQRVKDILLPLEDISNAAIKSVKEDFIKKESKVFDEALKGADFDKAALSGYKLYSLTNKKQYKQKITEAKHNVAESYIAKSTLEESISMRYRYIIAACQLAPDDVSIKEQKALIEKEFNTNKPRPATEEKMYGEKLYYLAAIALANNEHPKSAYDEFVNYNLTFKYFHLLEKYSAINGVIDGLKP
jgi:hypothetical protein